MSTLHTRNGFTTMEMLLAAVVAVLIACIMIFVINPAKQLRTARDGQRRTDIGIIADAIAGYAKDNNGLPPFRITTKPTPICRSVVRQECGDLINLNVLTGAYLPAIPADPKNATVISTAYTLSWDGHRISVTAPYGEQGEVIAVTRIIDQGKK